MTSYNFSYRTSDFKALRDQGLIYADKTDLIYILANSRTSYFLSRPRRFGKTLLLSTFEYLFEGRKDIFDGKKELIYGKEECANPLWIVESEKSRWDWTTTHPVIKLDFSTINNEDPQKLKKSLCRDLLTIARFNDVNLNDDNPVDLLKSLIEALYRINKNELRAAGKNEDIAGPVVLIDEYDAPILANIANPGLAERIRDELKIFYAALKGAEGLLRFTFVTGVTNFTKTSLFSGANHLVDLTLDRDYANICGFTPSDFDQLFEKHLENRSDDFKETGQLPPECTPADLKRLFYEWYDGYCWDGKTRVLNPWSVLECFRLSAFGAYWFATGPPEFLVKVLKDANKSLEFFKGDSALGARVDVMDIGNIDPAVLMFQTGYLTIKEKANGKNRLDFPNLEVKGALAPLLLSYGGEIDLTLQLLSASRALKIALTRQDPMATVATFNTVLAAIPYQSHLSFEAFFQLVLIFSMALAGQHVTPEGSVGGGRYDIHLTDDKGDDFIIELKHIPAKELEAPKSKKASKTAPGAKKAKIISPEKLKERNAKKIAAMVEEAMSQIEQNHYAEKFRGTGDNIWKTALVFGGRRLLGAEFRLAENWYLEMEPGGGYTVVMTAGE